MALLPRFDGFVIVLAIVAVGADCFVGFSGGGSYAGFCFYCTTAANIFILNLHLNIKTVKGVYTWS